MKSIQYSHKVQKCTLHRGREAFSYYLSDNISVAEKYRQELRIYVG